MHPVRQVFNATPAPRPVLAHLMYFEPVNETPEFWTVRLYRDNFDSFSGEDRLIISNWVSDVLKKMKVFYPHCYVEAYETYGGNNGNQSIYS